MSPTPRPSYLDDVDDVVAVRRDLHAHPELGFTEIRTAALVLTALERLGWTARCGRDVFDITGLPGLPDAQVLDAAEQRALEEGVPSPLVQQLRGGNTAVVAELTGNRPGPTVALRCDMDALPILKSIQDDHRPTRLGFSSRHPGASTPAGTTQRPGAEGELQ
ncbi:hypothetical protein MOQ72_38395 [Saccharopolyspora sp. K220]|uniref:hypothetical protein n=1 Tax=Saccharopolyspora soli TaxID=2926618 RepID=UPI001F5AAE11|nr:hypothetical protein [Saccharopolyspora soli]MCI2423306.1 hypothetical protein [Saccharopolyspora soli]